MSRRNGNTKNGHPEVVGSVRTDLQDANGQNRYPNLFACLAPIFVEGKCTRLAGRLSVAIAGGYYRCTVSCPSEGLEMTCLSGDLTELLAQVEDVLTSGRAPWVPDFATRKRIDKEAKH